jgi:hypothetical protein
VKPVRKTKKFTTQSAGGGTAVKVHIGTDMKPDGGNTWSVEAMSLRASYVGPVLEGILHKMEENWNENPDLEP